MKKILIFGDSNVWGDNFLTGKRIDDDKQWPIILQKQLGNNYKIIQEGLPGRIAGNEENVKKYKNGKDAFISTFKTNAPVDLVIIALGTNDLQIKYNKSSQEIINDLLWYKKFLENCYLDLDDRKKFFKNENLVKIIYILPINFDYKKNAKNIFTIDSERKRQEIIKYFVANEKEKTVVLNEMPLFDDGIHLNYDGHQKMANIIQEVLESVQ
ncbi:MAG: hypothetical protein HFI09_04845 [Bacilli bacterium]|nr:hypothetical protein [Bacilli bacterium]